MSTTSEHIDGNMKKAQSLYHHGNEAVQKGNLDYATSMYREACKLVPGHLPFRLALRGVQRKKFGNDPAKAGGGLTRMRIKGILVKYRGSKSKGRWGEVLEGTEDAFTLNPWSIDASRDAAEAAMGLNQPEMAKWLLTSVEAQAGDDIEFLQQLAEVHAANKDFKRSIQCWERIRKIQPHNEDASRQINAMAANSTIMRSGLDRALDVTAPKSSIKVESFSPDVDDLAEQAMAPEQRYLNQIESHPERVGPYLELSDLYRMRGRLEEAEKILARGLKAIPGDSVLKMNHAEVQISRLHKAIEEHSEKLKRDPDNPTAKSNLKKLKLMLNDYEVKEYRRRSELAPEDAGLRLQFGIRLARAGQHDQAIAEFQKARSDPELRVQALLQAGLAFEATGVLKLAERNYADALKSADPADSATQLELNYRLGRVFEAQGDTRSAEEHYQEVAAQDYGYQDVAQRLRNLNQVGPAE